MKPACEIDEYASSRFTSRCASAARFPQASEMHASTATAIVQISLCVRERGDEDAQHHDERGGLRRRRHERRDRGRSALVHVRRPHVERRGGDLEREPGEDHREPGEEERVVSRLVRRRSAEKPSSPVAP